MKKLIVVIIALCLLCVVFVGCSSQTSETQQNCYIIYCPQYNYYLVYVLYKQSYFDDHFENNVNVACRYYQNDYDTKMTPSTLYGARMTNESKTVLEYVFLPNSYICFMIPTSKITGNKLTVDIYSYKYGNYNYEPFAIYDTYELTIPSLND